MSTSKTARAASALKSGVGGVVLGGTAIFSAMNGFTPHMAGAIDIMVVEQPDGSLKCSPFYVRFGKYTPMRAKDKVVRISVNGEEAPFSMHLGAYGQAYFTAETTEIVSDADDDDDVLEGMMSPPSGYSSADEGAPYANEEILSAVQQEVARLKRASPSGGATDIAGQQQSAISDAHPSVSGQGVLPPSSLPQDGAEGKEHQELQQEGKEQHAEDDSHARPRSRLALSSKASIRRGSAGSGSDSGLESSSELSDSSTGSTKDDATSAAAALTASELTSTVPADGQSAEEVAALVPQLSPSRAAALVEAATSASMAAKASTLAAPCSGPLEDLLLDSKYSVTAADSLELDELKAQQQVAGHERVQHAHVVRNRSVEAQKRGEELQEELSTSGGAGEVPEAAAAVGAAAAQPEVPVAAEAGSAAAGVHEPQRQSTGGDAPLVKPAGLPPRPQAPRKAAVLGTPAAAATQVADGEGGADAVVDVQSQDADLAAGGLEKHESVAPTTPQQQQQPQQQHVQAQAQTESQAPALQEVQVEVPPVSLANGDGKEVALPPLRAANRHTPGLLSTSIKAHDEAVAAAAATAASAVATEALQAAAGADVDRTAEEPATTQLPELAASNGGATPALAASQPVPITIPSAAAHLQPVAPDGLLGLSPSDAGYLADSEGPRSTAGGAMAASSAPFPAPQAGISPMHCGSMALGGQGFQMSLCGHFLRRGTPPAEALQVFEANRVTAEAWASTGMRLLTDPCLVVKVGVALYPWSAAAPMVMGMLAFGGGQWHEAFAQERPDARAWHPLRLQEDRQGQAKKGSAVAGTDADGGAAGAGVSGMTPPGASSSWRLWPFSGWRDGTSGGGSKPASAVAAAAGSGGNAAAGGTSPRSSKGGGAPAASDTGSAAAAATLGGSPPTTGLLGAATTAAAGLSLPLSRAGSGAISSAGGASPRRRSAAAPPPPRPRRHIVIIRKTLMPTPEQLASLPLRFGSNTISFRCSAGGSSPLTAYVYYYPWNSRLVISDVDGTITRSDLLGHVLPSLGVDWSHPGITQLFHNIAANGYQIMFLSSRAISQANITRDYLHKLVQNGYKMPCGPVIISPHGLLPSLYREVVQRRPHEFKIACLEDIRALFPPDWNPFYAGFGNRDTDVVSYREVGVPTGRTFIINPKGQICKGSAVVQSSMWSTLSAINTLVDEVFPAVQEMLDIMRGASAGMRAAGKAVLAANRLLSASGALKSSDPSQEQQQQQQDDDEQQQGQGQQQERTSLQGERVSQPGQDQQGQPLASRDGGASPTASEASRQSLRSCVRLLGPSAVGPQRDEFNDAQYWRTSLAFDIESELHMLEVQGASKGSSRRTSHAADPSAVASGSSFTLGAH